MRRGGTAWAKAHERLCKIARRVDCAFAHPTVLNLHLRPIPLEYRLICETGRHRAVLRGAHSPGEKRQSEQKPRRPRRDGGEIVHPMGEEGGAAHRRVQQKCQLKALRRIERLPNMRWMTASGDDTADNARSDAPQFGDGRRVERNDGDRAGITRKHSGGSRREPQVAVEPALVLDDSLRRIMEPAMGDWASRQPREGGFRPSSWCDAAL